MESLNYHVVVWYMFGLVILCHLNLSFAENTDKGSGDDFSRALNKALKKPTTSQTPAVNPDNIDSVLLLEKQAQGLEAINEYVQAEKLRLKILHIRRENHENDHPSIGIALDNLGMLYWQMKQYQDALKYVSDAVKIFENLNNSYKKDLAIALNNLAIIHKDLGGYHHARNLLIRVKNIEEVELSYSDDNYALAQTWFNLGLVEQSLRHFDESLELLGKACPVFEKHKGMLDAQSLICRTKLSNIYLSTGNTEKGNKLFDGLIIKIIEKDGKNSKLLLEPLYFRALLCHELGDEICAQSMNKNIISICKAKNKSSTCIKAYINLGEVYRALGNYPEAVKQYEIALGLIKPTEHSMLHLYAMVNNNMGMLQYDRGQFEQSLVSNEIALTFWRQALGDEHPQIAQSLLNGAGTLRQMGEFKQAENLLLKAIAILDKTVRDTEPIYSHVLSNLGGVYENMSDYEGARENYLRALKIRENLLGKNHLAVAGSYINLAQISALQGNMSDAINYHKKANAISQITIERILFAGSEKEKQYFIEKFRNATYGTITLHANMAPDNKEAMALSLATIAQRKGILLDVMAETFKRLQQENIKNENENLQKLAQLYTAYSDVIFDTTLSYEPDMAIEKIKVLKASVDEVERKIARSQYDLEIKLKQVELSEILPRLPSDGVLLEFMRFRPYKVQKNKPNNWGDEQYIVYALYPDGRIDYRVLGSAGDIDKLIESYLLTIRSPTWGKKAIRRAASSLYPDITKPLLELMGKKTHVLVSPDGLFNLLPFSALQDKNEKYLLQKKYKFTYLSSSRDLLRTPDSSEKLTPPVIIAAPDYGAQSQAESVAHNSAAINKYIYMNRKYSPLPKTLEEATAIQEVYPNSIIVTNKQATEELIKSLKFPQFLHLATHGFFLHVDDDDLGLQVHPLLMSGLVFSEIGNSRKSVENGLLTALEVSMLELSGTRISVLSACNTGVGTVRNGEGVYGLRRAFVLAGTETQVLSLWKVSDTATKELMKIFYGHLAQNEFRYTAMYEAQKAMFDSKNYKHPFYWAAFIVSGQWGKL